MRRAVRGILAPTVPSIALLLAAGCAAATGGGDGLDTTLDDIQRQLFKLQKDSAAQSQALQDLRRTSEGRDDGEREAFADIQVKIDQLAAQMLVLGEQLLETQDQLRALSQEMRLERRTMTLPPRPSPVEPGPAEPGAEGPGDAARASPPVEPEELFNRAYADYSRKNYPLAAWQFGEFLRVHPDSSLSDDAQYWIGECHFAQGDYRDAAGAFEELIARYPAGDKVPAAHLKSGLAYLQLRQTKEAVLQLQHVIDTYPGTDEARIAREQLRQRGLGRN